jgi:hypothetical protein
MKNKSAVLSILIVCLALGFAWAATQEEPASQPASPAENLVVDEAVICTGVVDRVPQGVPTANAPAPAEMPAETTPQAQPPAEPQEKPPAEPQAQPETGSQPMMPSGEVSFPPDVGKLFCFTKISGGNQTTIKHVWYFGENPVSAIELTLGGSPWRTWSEKSIAPTMTGAWKVEIQDSAGTVLKTLSFEVK